MTEHFGPDEFRPGDPKKLEGEDFTAWASELGEGVEEGEVAADNREHDVARAEAIAHGSAKAHERLVAARKGVEAAGPVERAALVVDRLEEAHGNAHDFVTTGKLPNVVKGLDRTSEQKIRDEMLRSGVVSAQWEREMLSEDRHKKAAKYRRQTTEAMTGRMEKVEATHELQAIHALWSGRDSSCGDCAVPGTRAKAADVWRSARRGALYSASPGEDSGFVGRE